jgi:hippurate hydrolase
MDLPGCNIDLKVQENYSDLLRLRREMHENPELLYDLPKTREIILNYLSGLDIEVLPVVGESGIVAQITGEGPCILFRADMDALSISETTSSPFKSKTQGRMHACGHDGHMAMLLVAAKVLAQERASLRGSVKFVFQPAEEGGHGSKAMIQDLDYPVLKNPEVQQVFGIHITNGVALGDFVASPKYASCNSDYFFIDVVGKGGHASAPYLTRDPIIAGTHLVMALQTIVSRNIEPYRQAVLSVTMLNSGEVFNAIPDKCTINGTIRTFENESKDLIEKRILDLCAGIESGFNCQVNCKFTHYYNPTINNPESVQRTVEAFRKVCPNSNHGTISPMIAEDFFYFTDEKPGCFMMLGTGTDQLSQPLHSSSFDFDERGLLIGASYWVQLAKDILK